MTSQRLAIDFVRMQRIAGDFVFSETNVTREARRNDLVELENRILQTSERIVLGANFVDESTGLESNLDPTVDEVARRILLDDGCFGAEEYAECRNASGAVLRSGIRNTAVSLVRIDRSVRLQAPVPDLEAGQSLFMLS